MRVVIATAAILLTPIPLLAADLVPSPKPKIESCGPTFTVTGYLWASALNGRSSTLPPLPATDIDLSFGDILKNMNGAMMGTAEMRLGRWGFVTDAMFSQVTAGGALPGPYFSSAKVRSQTLTLQASVLYRLYTDERVDLDVGAGFRFWKLDNRLTIQPGALNLQINHSDSENWFDPIIGARMSTRLGGPWSITLAGDFGGLDAGAKLTWQALGTVNYQWNDNLMIRAGYRALYVDYHKDDFFYDTTMHGPVIAATYRF